MVKRWSVWEVVGTGGGWHGWLAWVVVGTGGWHGRWLTRDVVGMGSARGVASDGGTGDVSGCGRHKCTGGVSCDCGQVDGT